MKKRAICIAMSLFLTISVCFSQGFPHYAEAADLDTLYGLLTVSGIEGPFESDDPGIEDGFYLTKGVTVTAPSGYEIKINAGDSEWETQHIFTAEDLEWSEISQVIGYGARNFYIRDKETEEVLSEDLYFDSLLNKKGYDIDYLYFDLKDPAIESQVDGVAESISNGQTVCAEEVDIKISDKNLKTVTLNGATEELTLVDGIRTAFLTVMAESGSVKNVAIHAEDLMGNGLDLSFKVTTGIEVTMNEAYYYGDTIEPVVSLNGLDGTPTLQYKKSGQADSAFSGNVPVNVGDYILRVTLPETENHGAMEVRCEFSIQQKEVVTSTITCEDIFVGGTLNPKIETISDTTDITYFYKKSTEDDEAYSDTVPIAAGTYTVKALLGETPNVVEHETDSCEFEIRKLKPTSSISVSPTEVDYGETYDIFFTTDSDGSKKVEFKVSGADDSTYTTKKPTESGKYVVRGTVAASTNYEADQQTTTFTIKKKADPVDPDPVDPDPVDPDPVDPDPEKKEIVTEDPKNIFYYGTDYSMDVKVTDGPKTNMILSPEGYRRSGETSWSTYRPTAPGLYEALYKYPEKGEYKAYRKEISYSIVYLPTPATPYTITGVQGKNQYFTGDVSIEAPEGYGISYTLGTGYEAAVAFDTEKDYVYLRRTSDGALTTAIPVRTVKQDADLPSLMDDIRDENGNLLSLDKPIYANKLIFTIQDDHLVSVKINGAPVDILDNKALISLDTNGGAQSLNVEAEDEAGNIFRATILFNAAWMKNMTVPSGVVILLQTGNRYNLDSGKWSMNGDATVYNGGMTFYVRKDRESTFSKLY